MDDYGIVQTLRKLLPRLCGLVGVTVAFYWVVVTAIAVGAETRHSAAHKVALGVLAYPGAAVLAAASLYALARKSHRTVVRMAAATALVMGIAWLFVVEA